MGVRRKSVVHRLGHECAKARFDARAKQANIAVRAGVSPPVLSRFENCRGGWPDRVEEIVHAYELECGLQPEDIWRRAICRR